MLLSMKSCYHVNRQVYSGSRCHQLNYIYINHFALWVSRWDWKRSFNGKLENVSLICCKNNVEHCSLFMAHAIACINSINPKCWIYVKLFFSALLLYVPTIFKYVSRVLDDFHHHSQFNEMLFVLIWAIVLQLANCYYQIFKFLIHSNFHSRICKHFDYCLNVISHSPN